nr:hypothetical protein [Tanacetum cinerariifolium]
MVLSYGSDSLTMNETLSFRVSAKASRSFKTARFEQIKFSCASNDGVDNNNVPWYLLLSGDLKLFGHVKKVLKLLVSTVRAQGFSQVNVNTVDGIAQEKLSAACFFGTVRAKRGGSEMAVVLHVGGCHDGSGGEVSAAVGGCNGNDEGGGWLEMMVRGDDVAVPVAAMAIVVVAAANKGGGAWRRWVVDLIDRDTGNHFGVRRKTFLTATVGGVWPEVVLAGRRPASGEGERGY